MYLVQICTKSEQSSSFAHTSSFHQVSWKSLKLFLRNLACKQTNQQTNGHWFDTETISSLAEAIV